VQQPESGGASMSDKGSDDKGSDKGSNKGSDMCDEASDTPSSDDTHSSDGVIVTERPVKLDPNGKPYAMEISIDRKIGDLLNWETYSDMAAELVTAVLAAATPEACSEKNENDDYPLHLACMHNAPLEIIDKILAAWPDAAKYPDMRKWYPLHWAALARMQQAVIIENLLPLCPEAAAAKTSTDRTAADIVELEDNRPKNKGTPKSEKVIALLRAWEKDPDKMMEKLAETVENDLAVAG